MSFIGSESMKTGYLVCINYGRGPKGYSYKARFLTPSNVHLTSFPSLPVCTTLKGTHQTGAPLLLRGHLPPGLPSRR